jgi:poly(glycerol-phosphate) alpha-glucosyltransferase
VIELPEGRYLSCAFGVSADAAGQTRALLMRNRFLAREAGVRPTVLAFGAAPDYEERRRVLLERGLLSERVSLLSIYDHYREHGWGEAEASGEPLPDLATRRVDEEARPDGTPWRISYRAPDGRLVYDYLRADGTPYLRIPRFGVAERASWRATIHRLGPAGEPVGEFSSVGRWYRHFIRELAEGHERAFVFIDSRFLIPHVVPLRKRGIHVLYQMHNMHLEPPRRWDSDLHPVYRRVLARIDDMDAIVNLTERQRDDIAARRGRTTNMFVVPNPVDVPELPSPLPPRDPHRVMTMARLETQKRLVHAIAAFRRVVEAVPEAKLDIYGEGSQRAKLQTEIERSGLTGSVTLRGYDPHAREALWSASAFLLTSEYEGYPLSTLEAMSQGCPVVSYDIRYGPREQIGDGVGGFVVPEGDEAALAGRVIELLRSPDLVRRMSAAAREKVARYGPAEFVERWAQVIHAAVALEPDRTRIEEAAFEVTRLRRRRRALHLRGVLSLKGRGELDSARLRLDAVHQESGEVVELPVEVERVDEGFRVAAKIALDDALPAEGVARLRLRLTWHNSAWETEIARPLDDPVVSFGPGGVVQLVR